MKESFPVISVIMSVFNNETYLTESIKSILNQSFSDFEFIIVNDGSTDNSLKIIDHFSKSDKRIVLINNPKNIGLTKSLNISINVSKGIYIARMDGDDIALIDRFEKQYNYLEKYSDIFLLGSEAIKIDSNGNKLSTVKLTYGFNEIKNTLKEKNCIIHPTIFFRNNKEIFYREKFVVSQDYDFYLNLLTKNLVIENYGQPLIYHRVFNEESISNNKLKQQLLLKELARAFYFERTKFGFDSYNNLDFFKLNEVFKFLKLNEADLNNKVVELSVLKYLQKGQYLQAKKILKEYRGDYLRKLMLTSLVTFPYVYTLYRFLKYKNK
ncbi:MAG: glycosyltransferase [bacterium]